MFRTSLTNQEKEFEIYNSILFSLPAKWNGKLIKEAVPAQFPGDPNASPAEFLTNNLSPPSWSENQASSIFVNPSDPDGPDNEWFTDDDGLRLKAGSPAIDAGNNVYNDAIADLAGRPRNQGNAIDVGAYEYGDGEFYDLAIEILPEGAGTAIGAGEYVSDTVAELVATPNAGFVFGVWDFLSFSSSDNPASLAITGPTTAVATFKPDDRDNDSDGLSNYFEIIVIGTNPDDPDTDGDGFTDGEERSNGTDPKVPDALVSWHPNQTYTGDSFNPLKQVVLNSEDITSQMILSYTLEGEPLPEGELPVSPGAYTATARFPSSVGLDPISRTFRIFEPEVSVVWAQNLVFNGSSFDPLEVVKFNGEDITSQMVVTYTTPTAALPAGQLPIFAGEYSARAHFPAHLGMDDLVHSFTISPPRISIVWNPDLVHTGTPLDPLQKVSFNGEDITAQMAVVYLQGSTSLPSGQLPSAVGTYKALLQFPATHPAEDILHTFHIQPQAVQVQWNENLVANGEPQSPLQSAVYNGADITAQVTATYSKDGVALPAGELPVQPGTYTAVLQFPAHLALNDISHVFTIQATSGSALWEYREDRWISRMAVDKIGRVFFTIHHWVYNDLVVGLSASGNKLWEFEVTANALDIAVGEGDILYVATSDSTLALDPATGAKVWESQKGCQAFAISSQGTVLCLDDESYFALDAGNGSLIWETPLPSDYGLGESNVYGGGSGEPVIGHDGIFYFAVRYPPTLFAVESRDGSILWQSDLSSLGGYAYVYDIAIGTDGSLYVSGDGGLLAVDGATGQLNWEYLSPGGYWPSLVLSPGLVHFGGTALDPATGALKWESGRIFETAIATDGFMFAQTYSVDSSEPSAISQLDPSNGSGTDFIPSLESKYTVTDLLTQDDTLYTIEAYWYESPRKIVAYKIPAGNVRSPWPMRGGNAQQTGQAYNPDASPNAPLFTVSSQYRFRENSSSLAVASLVAEDADGDPVSYSIVGGEDHSLFSINAQTGQLSFLSMPDYESPGAASGGHHYKLRVKASDGVNSRTLGVSVFLDNDPADDPVAGTGIGSYATGGNVFSSPAIGGDGTVYFGSWDKKVHAVDGATNAKKWEFETGGWVSASPSIGADGTVYVGSYDWNVYALDGQDGSKKWQFRTGNLVFSSAAIGSEGTVFVGSWDGKVYALDGATGAKSWEYTTGGQVSSSPALGDDGTVYIGSGDYKFYALDRATGSPLWSFQTGGDVKSSPAIGPEGLVYFGSEDKKVYALSTATGEKKWEFSTGGTVLSSPTLGDDGTVYIGSQDYSLYALDSLSGSKKWQFFAGAQVRSKPAVAGDGSVIFGTWNGNLYSLDGATGAKQWEHSTGSAINSSPVISPSGKIFVGTDAGKLYSVQGSSGPAETARARQGHSPRTGIFGREAEVGYGWRQMDWLGLYYVDEPTGWIYHGQYGWMYPAGKTARSAWFYIPSQGWVWTSVKAHPMFYSSRLGTWLWHGTTTQNARWWRWGNTTGWYDSW